MAKIITIPNDNDPVMNSERERIVIWAATHGWLFAGYNDETDHIVQIKRVGAGAPLEFLDFDCHGNPTVFDHTYLAGAIAFGRNLSTSTGFSANTAVYLDACNTGLTSSFGGPIAQEVANGARCTVYGTKGYMTGTYAEENERCYASVDGHAPYPGGQDATGRKVWIAFHPIGAVIAKSAEELDMATGRTVNVTQSSRSPEVAIVADLIETILESPTTQFPSLRMAPDVTVNYPRRNQILVLDVYANGGLIRERATGVAWRVINPDEFRQALVRAMRG